ncbi:MAG: hypothetical protein GY804_06430 [Alphaproteobacteria bacterium]|nr:hypothetical protein [Alphaproteobacteria bacterium]
MSIDRKVNNGKLPQKIANEGGGGSGLGSGSFWSSFYDKAATFVSGITVTLYTLSFALYCRNVGAISDLQEAKAAGNSLNITWCAAKQYGAMDDYIGLLTLGCTALVCRAGLEGVKYKLRQAEEAKAVQAKVGVCQNQH